LKIYHKIFEPDKYALLKAFSIICGAIFCVYSIPFFLAIFLSVTLLIPLPHVAGKFPLLLVYSENAIAESLAYGVSGFLMSFIVISISRRKNISPIIYVIIFVSIFSVGMMVELIFYFQVSLFYKIYLILELILKTLFLFGFAILGAWLLTREKLPKVSDKI